LLHLYELLLLMFESRYLEGSTSVSVQSDKDV
jgi:hypothetical protein